MTTTNPRLGSSILAHLRAIAPHRGLSRSDALLVAQNQADALLAHSDAPCEPIEIATIGQLPRVVVSSRRGLASSGLSFWDGDNWHLIADADEHPNRQRFSLAHEYKHVIDHPVRDLLYASHRERELAADHFAACLLMPRRFVTRAWCAGIQDVHQLADRFAVSPAAMQRRLRDLGHLTRPAGRSYRCRRLPKRSAFAMDRSNAHPGVPL